MKTAIQEFRRMGERMIVMTEKLMPTPKEDEKAVEKDEKDVKKEKEEKKSSKKVSEILSEIVFERTICRKVPCLSRETYCLYHGVCGLPKHFQHCVTATD
ncbi:unnamed protein product [Gongylonema pulchrum]|uniref:Uncharacterized protein n=1 Tax=Gongylonema pulchrum TaxID=637853 RepID=A0A183DMJ1_9BILA|nr:unnamed protein product [Gongylonema pulchrum]